MNTRLLRHCRHGTTSAVFVLVARSGERSINAPSKPAESVAQRSIADVEVFCPFIKTFRDPVKCQFRSVARVSRLVFLSGPFAIFLAIVPVVINALKRMLFAWSGPHVQKKLLETFPFFTKSYSASAIRNVVPTFGIDASIPHGGPRSVFTYELFSEHILSLPEGDLS